MFFQYGKKEFINVDENKINETLQELSECREDERNSKNQVLQTITAVATVLSFILGASIFRDRNETNVLRSDNITLVLYLLSVVVLLCGVSYIAYLGIEDVLRFHYIRHLEDSLSSISDKESTIIHWISLNSAINTKNIKHIFTSHYTLVSYCFYFIATTFAILFCLGLISIHYLTFEFNKKILIICPVTFILVVFIFFIWISLKAKDMYNFSFNYSVKKQKERLFRCKINFINMNKENNMIKFYIKGLVYFLYPQTKDFQKIIFVLGGYILGIFLAHEHINFSDIFNMHIKKLSLY